MARVRFGVVLLVPQPFADEIDGLRRALDDSHLGQVAPHLTLVPPVNVRVEAIPEALQALRASSAALADAGSLELVLGPPASFRPATDTLYLAVSGSTDAMAALSRLRDRVFVPPLERELEWPFVPHVTIAEGIAAERIDGAGHVLAGYEITVAFDRVHLLQEQRDDEGRRRWVPVADAPFASPAIVGRGGIELELSTSCLIDPEARAFLAAELPADPNRPPDLPTSVPGSSGPSGSSGLSEAPAAAEPLVVTARRRGAVVGVAHGWGHDGERELAAIVVAREWRDHGIGRQLRLAFAAAPAPT